MATATDTVHSRIGRARGELSAGQMAAGSLLLLALGFVLLCMQDPLLHDSMHAFRHAAGVTCH